MLGRKKACPVCNYQVIEQDLYCAYCGCQLFDFRVKPARLIYYVDPDSPGVMRRQLTFQDGGWGHPVVECGKTPEWLRFDPGTLTLTVDTEQLPYNEMPPETITIRARGTDAEREIAIHVAPLPDPQIAPLSLATGYTDGVPARLEMEIYSPATLENIIFRPEHLKLNAALPIELTVGQNTIPLTACIPSGKAGGTGSIKCAMTFGGLTKALERIVSLNFQDPPSLGILEIDGGYAPPVLNEAEGEFVLTCKNQGRGVNLVVDEISITPRSNAAAPAIEFSAEPSRASIEKSKSAEFVFQARRTGNVAPRRYRFDVIVRCNDPSLERTRRTLAVDVTSLLYTQWVALDYGTIDSTIAVFDPTEGAKNLLLERRPDKDPKIYSNVFFSNYLSGQTPPYEWEIGARAAALGTSSHGKLVTAAKVRIDTGSKEYVDFGEIEPPAPSVSPEQVVTLALRSLLVRTKYEIKQRPYQFAMCVPTRFTLRRKEILQECLKEAARQLSMDITVRLLDESLAAGVFSFRKGTVGGSKPEFTAMVVDFGGGTTDVTVFRVKRDPATNRLRSAEIIGAWGDPELGGEEITKALSTMLLGEFGETGSAPVDIRKMSVEAETLKLVISELEEAKRQAGSPQLSALLERLSPRAKQRISYVCWFKSQASPDELRESIQEYLDTGSLSVRSQWYGNGKILIKFPADKLIQAYETRLQNLKKGLRSLLERISLEQVDQVLLAGQSSRFPTVRENLQEFGVEIDFIRNEKGEALLKECVSQGALMLVGEGIAIEGEYRLWTRLGCVAGVSFQELIGWGSTYPIWSEEIEFTRHQVFQGSLHVEIMENLSLDANLPLTPFARFKIDVGSEQGPFHFKLHLDKQAAVHGSCRFANGAEQHEMERVS